MNSKLKTYALNVLFLIVLFIVTFYYIFIEQNFCDVIKYIQSADKVYILLSVAMVLLFVCGESVIIHYLMNSFSRVVKLTSCIKYSFIGFFVSYITPGASGGQPAQMYYMSKDGIRVSESSLILMVVTIAYKAVLIIMGVFMLATESSFLFNHITGSVAWILIIGLILNILIIGLLFFIIFKQSFARNVLVAPIIWLGKKRIIRNYQKWTKKILGGINKYADSAEYLKKHKYVIFNAFVLTAAQRICLFMVTYFVYKSFGLSGTSMYQIITLQTMIALSVDNLPLPGGMGASESIFVIFFDGIFRGNGMNYVLPGMVLSRSISFYSIIVIGGIITCITHLTRKRNKRQVS